MRTFRVENGLSGLKRRAKALNCAQGAARDVCLCFSLEDVVRHRLHRPYSKWGFTGFTIFEVPFFGLLILTLLSSTPQVDP